MLVCVCECAFNLSKVFHSLITHTFANQIYLLSKQIVSLTPFNISLKQLGSVFTQQHRLHIYPELEGDGTQLFEAIVAFINRTQGFQLHLQEKRTHISKNLIFYNKPPGHFHIRFSTHHTRIEIWTKSVILFLLQFFFDQAEANVWSTGLFSRSCYFGTKTLQPHRPFANNITTEQSKIGSTQSDDSYLITSVTCTLHFLA